MTTIVLVSAVMLYAVVKLGVTPHVPLAANCVIAGLVARWAGYRWNEIMESMTKGISEALDAMLILLCVGILMGAWIACGTVSTVIYYGIRMISPKLFLPSVFLICATVSMVAGSWGTAGTVGLALMAAGSVMGISPAFVAGAVVTGSYFGEVCSPLSDAVALAAAVSGCDVGETARKGILPAIISGVLAVGVFALIGVNAHGTGNVGQELQSTAEALRVQFRIHPLCLVPLLVVVICLILRVPSLPALLAGAGCGIILAICLQGCSVNQIVRILYDGFVSTTGDSHIDALMTAGGCRSMFSTVVLIIIATGFGGLMRGTGQMAALAEPLLRRVRGRSGLFALTIISGIAANILMPDQALGISVPAQMYRDAYREQGLPASALSNAISVGGALTSPMVPWNSCGIYMSAILGVATLNYLRCCCFSLIAIPVMFVVLTIRYSAHKPRPE